MSVLDSWNGFQFRDVASINIECFAMVETYREANIHVEAYNVGEDGQGIRPIPVHTSPVSYKHMVLDSAPTPDELIDRLAYIDMGCSTDLDKEIRRQIWLQFQSHQTSVMIQRYDAPEEEGWWQYTFKRIGKVQPGDICEGIITIFLNKPTKISQ